MLIDCREGHSHYGGDFLEGRLGPDPQGDDFAFECGQSLQSVLQFGGVEPRGLGGILKEERTVFAGALVALAAAAGGFEGVECGVSDTDEEPGFGVGRRLGLGGQLHEDFLDEVFGGLELDPLARVKDEMRRVGVEPIRELCRRDQ